MRKVTVSVCWIMALLLFATVSLASEQGGFKGPGAGGRGGFHGPSSAAVTVEKAKTLSDDTHVVLRGKIVRHISKDKYEFRDATDLVVVEISDDKWGGQTITPEDTVELRGEVDRDLTSLKIDVDRVTRVQ